MVLYVAIMNNGSVYGYIGEIHYNGLTIVISIFCACDGCYLFFVLMSVIQTDQNNSVAPQTLFILYSTSII